MEISDYVKSSMSFDQKEKFLEERDTNIKEYTPILLTVTGWPGKYMKSVLSDEKMGLRLEYVLEELAEKAQNEGCEYVTEITINPVAGNGFLFWYQPQRLYVAGIGLIKNEE